MRMLARMPSFMGSSRQTGSKFAAECPHCEARFEFVQSDATGYFDEYGRYCLSVYCPCCRATIYVLAADARC